MTSLVERLREHATDWDGRQMADAEPAKGDPTAGTLRQAADRITALEAMCETLAGAFLETREMLGFAEQSVHAAWCPATWKTADDQPHCKLHEDILAVLLKHEATRDQALTQYRAMKERTMPMQVPTKSETVRTIHIQIGDEWTKADFGRDIPHAEAMAKARIILDTFDREKNDG